MITLHQPPPPPGWNVPNMSPFCVKLETYLRMAKLPYQTAPGNPLQAPLGKIPYVTIDGKKMGDSGRIIDFLRFARGVDLDAHLGPEQRATSLAIRRLGEEHLYFCGAYLRWKEDESFGYVKRFLLTQLPPVIGPLILKKLRRDFLASIYAQGVGRHTREAILAMAADDLAALATFLGKNDFFLGAEPSSVDASMYGLLVQLFWVPWESELTRIAKRHANLEKFCERMRARYWSS